jgi:chromosome segregation ATPase
MDAQQEITRLRNEVHAKDETLNQLKLKTKSFVDNLRNELAGEKKKVSELEGQLKLAKGASGSGGGATEDVERLKKEIATISAHENELKVRAKQFADSMKAQLLAEKDKTSILEKEVQAKNAALAAASKASSSHDLLGGFEEANAKQKDEEITSLKTQLSKIQQETAAAAEQLREAEAKAKQYALELSQSKQAADALKTSSDQQIARLQAEVSETQAAMQSQKSAQGSVESAFAHEHSELQAAVGRTQELTSQLQQFKIENEHLQKQLQDKDFLLEQMDSYRLRADDSEAKASTLRGELTVLNGQLAAKESEMNQVCTKCEDLKRELSEMATLYEKVNMGRSQSDSQLCEAQAALGAMQGVKQNLESVQARMEDVSKENMQLHEKVFQKESEIAACKSDVQRLTAELAQLQQTVTASKSDSFQRKQLADALEAAKKKADDGLRDALAKAAALEKKNQELSATVEAVTKDSTEKRQKAKALVISLTNEKQSCVDAKADLQKEVDRLRMELNQKNVENDRRLKQIQEENQQRMAQTATASQSLTEEIATLKQALMLVQESERSQQRAKELANAKREVEDSNKKRLAAKAETQKLAVELESVQKSLSQLVDGAATSCSTSVKKMNHLHDRVSEALHVLEKRASASGKKDGSPSSSPASRDVQVEDLRAAESAGRPLSPTTGAKRVEENIARVTDKVR